MHSHRPVSPEILDLLVKEINQRLSQADSAPLARVEEHNRGTERWNWTFLWQSSLKVADVRMFADARAVRINFLYLGEAKDSDKWVKLLHHKNESQWNEFIKFMGDLGRLENWHIIIQDLERKLSESS